MATAPTRLSALPSSPPDDLLAEIAAASEHCDALEREGLRVCFAADDAGLAVTLDDGRRLTRLAPSDALALAQGRLPPAATAAPHPAAQAAPSSLAAGVRSPGEG